MCIPGARARGFPGNFLITDNGLQGVLDWELTHLGDPMEDLGWLCVNAWRFGRRHLPVAGIDSREALYLAYQAATGITVDPLHARYWELLGTFKWGVICQYQAYSYLRGHVPSLERAAIGRRVAETEYDMLTCLQDITELNYAPNRPTASELVAAIAAYRQQPDADSRADAYYGKIIRHLEALLAGKRRWPPRYQKNEREVIKQSADILGLKDSDAAMLAEAFSQGVLPDALQKILSLWLPWPKKNWPSTTPLPALRFAPQAGASGCGHGCACG